ncbi:MAG TPA: TonB-dependent receptor [Gemmatimonadales bacterium]|nr:TonB-dependent receptor [Gemmatimonadales bacterium]
MPQGLLGVGSRTLGALLLGPALLCAQQPVSRDLASLDLEELANIKVTSVSRKPESLGTVAADVQVLTRDDIRRSGVTSLPELLRRVPGLQVARANSRDWSIGARGFNSASADKLLVLVDGRAIYSPIFAGVFWDVQDVVLADIERVEVILGPGASMWGSNAVNGVINVITLRATETVGGQAALDVGTEDRARVRARYGLNVGNAGAVRVIGQYLDRDAAARFGSDGDAPNEWRWGTAGARFDSRPGSRDRLSAQAQAYWGSGDRLRVLPAPAAPFVQPDSADLTASGMFGRVQWTRELSERSGFALQAYVDHSLRHDGAFWRRGRVNIFDLDFQHRLPLGRRHDLVWGAEYRLIDDDNAPSYTLAFDPPARTVSLATGFIEDDIDLGGGGWYLTAGARFERTTYTSLDVQPTARLRWSPRPGQTLWASVSRAVRSPSRLDEDIREVAGTIPTTPPITVVAAGVDRFEPERLTAYELGYRGEAAHEVGLAGSLFFHSYRRVRTLVPGAVDPATNELRYSVRNGALGESYGGTLSATWRVRPSWRLRASYTYTHTFAGLVDARPGEVLDAVSGVNPRHQASLQSSWDIGRTIELDLHARFVDSLEVAGVPEYAQADVRIGWRPVPALTIALVGQDLLARRHREFSSDVFVPYLSEIERRVLGRVVWRF